MSALSLAGRYSMLSASSSPTLSKIMYTSDDRIHCTSNVGSSWLYSSGILCSQCRTYVYMLYANVIQSAEDFS